MIRELINFTDTLDEEFKNLGSSPKEGLHIIVREIVNENGNVTIDSDNFKYEQYSKKQKDPPSGFLEKCKILHQNAWCIDTNKCFDLPTKAIHTCSPFAVAFKREHLEGGTKFLANRGNKKQIYERFEDYYFNKAFFLLENDEEQNQYRFFKDFFVTNEFSKILTKIDAKNMESREKINCSLEELKTEFKSSDDKTKKEIQ